MLAIDVRHIHVVFHVPDIRVQLQYTLLLTFLTNGIDSRARSIRGGTLNDAVAI